MMLWLTIATIVIAVAGALVALVDTVRGRAVGDAEMAVAALTTLALLVMVVSAVIGSLSEPAPPGSMPEFWAYLITACLMPAGAAGWGLIERSRYANAVLAIALLAVAIMVWRMHVVWFAL